MDIQAYIQSGILEQYLLGILTVAEEDEVLRFSLIYPEIKKELSVIEDALERLAAKNAVKPNPQLKGKILSSIFKADALDINNLPPTTPQSDADNWLTTVGHLIPARPYPDFYSTVLQQTDSMLQMLVVTNTDVPKETHTDIAESFFILKGRCICTVGDKMITLNPGDYLDIPLYIEHDVKIISSHVIAVLQHLY